MPQDYDSALSEVSALRAALEAAEREAETWRTAYADHFAALVAERDALKEQVEAQKAAIDAAIWFRDSFSGRIAGSYEASEAFAAALARLDQRETE